MKIQSGLSNGQVLQRQGKKGASFQLQGNCQETGTVHATIYKKHHPIPGWKNVVAGKAAKGQFTLSLHGIPAGGPYRLKLQAGKESTQVRVFYVGDVWILAGQSNMEGAGDMTCPAKPHPLIRSFSMRREWSLAMDPLHVLRESPDSCHNDDAVPFTPKETRKYRRTTKKGVGVGIFFACEMLKRSGVPQGLICTAHGGTSMTQWDPERKNEGGDALYGSMLLSVQATGQSVAGLLWYQGESDTNAEKVHYTERMEKLVAASRHDLHQPLLPWLVVQLARVFNDGDSTTDWNDIQEQQRLLPDRIKNLETVAAVDLPLDDGIHISVTGYPLLGTRLAHAADALVYKNKKAARPPQLREIRLNDSMTNSIGATGTSIDVVFDHVKGGLQAGGEPYGFSLVSETGKVWPLCYKTTLHGNLARLHLGQAAGDKLKLHYGHGTMPVCNITDGRGLSLPVFGPLPLIKQKAYLPFVTRWDVADLVESPAISLENLTCPDLSGLKTSVKSYGSEGFINEHSQWLKKSGHACFSAQLELPEPMKLQFLMGYDGPFRMWLDDEPLFTDLKGINPCLADESSATRKLQAGKYRLTVAMDINGGMAWGFMLRFLRLDIPKKQVKADTYKRPSYSA